MQMLYTSSFYEAQFGVEIFIELHDSTVYSTVLFWMFFF